MSDQAEPHALPVARLLASSPAAVFEDILLQTFRRSASEPQTARGLPACLHPLRDADAEEVEGQF